MVDAEDMFEALTNETAQETCGNVDIYNYE